MLSLSSTVGEFVSAADSSVEEAAKTIFKAFTRNQQIENDLSVESKSAVAVQDFYIALLRPTWGMDVGYASHAMSLRDGMAAPLTGILLENMFTGTRAVVDRSYGVYMQAAAELLFRVRSADLNFADTKEQALAALKTVIPGVRLSDTLVSGPKPSDQSLASATNLEVRFCVLGRELELDQDSDWINKLSAYSVTMYDQDKKKIAMLEGSGLIHPLDAVLMTRDSLLERGIQVQENDILAIGQLTEGFAVKDLSRLRTEFEGLVDGDPVFVYMGFR